MDPNACCQRIQDSRGNERKYACQDLQNWLASGGFKPYWKDYPLALKAYKKFKAKQREALDSYCFAECWTNC